LYKFFKAERKGFYIDLILFSSLGFFNSTFPLKFDFTTNPSTADIWSRQILDDFKLYQLQYLLLRQMHQTSAYLLSVLLGREIVVTI